MDEPADVVTMPSHVRATDFGHVLVLIDYHSGSVRGLLPAAADRFRRAARTGDYRALGKPLNNRLRAAGLVVPAASASPWPLIIAHTGRASWGSAEHVAGTARPDPGSYVDLLRGTGALATVASIKAAGRRRTAMLRVIHAIRLATSIGRRPATPKEAAGAVAAVRAAGWYAPGRTACLEESAAVVLLLATRRLTVTWCHGIAADPVRLHAWVQTEDGTAVGEPDSTGAYTPVLALGARHHQRN
ncbi:lasso peptide biosynthesis B2 protein [Kitasatospora sp. NPDC001527]|uniref:lasso peptide biosynthesis B2 protein n=1 Tax=Kitasatospora sp. NPDC001527 TaxID=3154519 RepID=UPI0033205302